MFSDATPAEDLLNRHLKLAPKIRLEQEYEMRPDGLEVSHVRVKKTGGLQYPLTIDGNVARLLAGCNGKQTLRQLLEDMAIYLEVNRDRVVSAVLPAVRSLIERGVLLVADV